MNKQLLCVFLLFVIGVMSANANLPKHEDILLNNAIAEERDQHIVLTDKVYFRNDYSLGNVDGVSEDNADDLEGHTGVNIASGADILTTMLDTTHDTKVTIADTSSGLSVTNIERTRYKHFGASSMADVSDSDLRPNPVSGPAIMFLFGVGLVCLAKIGAVRKNR